MFKDAAVNHHSNNFLFFFVLPGGETLGHAEESTGDELRQAIAVAALLLRERDHAESGRRALRLQVCVRPGGALHHGVSRRSAPRQSPHLTAPLGPQATTPHETSKT